jgi:hypothetical protein
MWCIPGACPASPHSTEAVLGEACWGPIHRGQHIYRAMTSEWSTQVCCHQWLDVGASAAVSCTPVESTAAPILQLTVVTLTASQRPECAGPSAGRDKGGVDYQAPTTNCVRVRSSQRPR